MRDPLELPDKSVIISDDDSAMEFMRRMGVLQKLAHPITLTGASAVFVKVLDHRSHWILCVRYSGFKRPSDNGYLVLTWPKRQFQEEPMSRYIADWSQQPELKQIVDLSNVPKRN
jgi:hypothetical protein